jgi:hypothetical protein
LGCSVSTGHDPKPEGRHWSEAGDGSRVHVFPAKQLSGWRIRHDGGSRWRRGARLDEDSAGKQVRAAMSPRTFDGLFSMTESDAGG